MTKTVRAALAATVAFGAAGAAFAPAQEARAQQQDRPAQSQQQRVERLLGEADQAMHPGLFPRPPPIRARPRDCRPSLSLGGGHVRTRAGPFARARTRRAGLGAQRAGRVGAGVQEFGSRRQPPSRVPFVRTPASKGNTMVLRRGLLAAAVAAACLGGVQPRRAVAQSSGTLNLQVVQDRTAPVPSLATTVGRLTGQDLHGSTGERLGRVDEVLQTRGGRIVAVSVQVGVGLLGVGGREVVLMLDQLRREGDRLVTTLGRAQVEAQPPWDG